MNAMKRKPNYKAVVVSRKLDRLEALAKSVWLHEVVGLQGDELVQGLVDAGVLEYVDLNGDSKDGGAA